MVLEVSAAILVRDNTIFAARRGKGRQLAGYWEFPGGKIEKGETPEQCLARELAEELSIKATIGPFFMTSEYAYETKNVVLHSYWVKEYLGHIELTDHDDMTWLGLNTLSALQWAPADIPIVKQLTLFLSANKII